MHREGRRVHAAQIALPAAAVERRVAIQQFLPETAVGHADAVILSRTWREVANEQAARQSGFRPRRRKLMTLRWISLQSTHSKPAGIGVQLVQRRLAAIEGIQVANPALQPGMKRRTEQMPIEACIVVPLRPLAELTAHE